MSVENAFALLPSFVLDDSDLTSLELRTYAKISQLCNKLGFCYAKNATLGQYLNAHEISISRAIKRLETKGYLKIEIKNGRDRKIYLNLDFKYFYDKENTLTNEQKQPEKAKTEPNEYKDTTEQEKQLKTQKNATIAKNAIVEKNPVIAKNATSDLKPKEKKPFFDMRSVELPNFINPQVWIKYCDYKAERKEKLTQTGIQAKFSEWKKWHDEGVNINECIETAMANEWRGVFKPTKKGLKNQQDTLDFGDIAEYAKNFNLGYDERFASEAEKAIYQMHEQTQRGGNGS